MTKLTANIETIVDGVIPDRAELWITSPAIKLLDTDEIKSGGLVKVPFNNGRLSIDLVPTDANTDPETWQYGFQVRYRNGSLPKFYAEVTGDHIDFVDLQPIDEADPVYLPHEISMDRVEGLSTALGTKVNSSTYVAGIANLQDQIDNAGGGTSSLWLPAVDTERVLTSNNSYHAVPMPPSVDTRGFTLSTFNESISAATVYAYFVASGTGDLWKTVDLTFYTGSTNVGSVLNLNGTNVILDNVNTDRTIYAASLTRTFTPGQFVTVNVQRNGSSGTDTQPRTVNFIGVRVVPA